MRWLADVVEVGSSESISDALLAENPNPCKLDLLEPSKAAAPLQNSVPRDSTFQTPTQYKQQDGYI